jgi:hypothetical protein
MSGWAAFSAAGRGCAKVTDLCCQLCATSCLLACEVDKPGAPDLRLAAGRFHIEKGVVKVVSSAAVRRQEKLITVQAPGSGSCKASDVRAPTLTKVRTPEKHPRYLAILLC